MNKETDRPLLMASSNDQIENIKTIPFMFTFRIPAKIFFLKISGWKCKHKHVHRQTMMMMMMFESALQIRQSHKKIYLGDCS